MKLLIAMIASLFLFTACSAEKDSDEGQDPAKQCGCSPKASTSNPQEIDRMRMALMESWDQYRMETGELETAFSAQQEIFEYVSNDDSDEKKCHFIATNITHETIQTGVDVDEEGNATAIFEVERTMGGYRLGNETTADATTCRSLANGIKEYAAEEANLGNFVLLFVDKLIDSSSFRPALAQFIPKDLKLMKDEVDIKIIPRKMISGTYGDFEVYQLIYNVKSDDFNGTFGIRFSGNTSPMSRVWSNTIKGSANGYPVNQTIKLVDTINGVALPN